MRGQRTVKTFYCIFDIYLISACVVYNIIICECENRKEMSDTSSVHGNI